MNSNIDKDATLFATARPWDAWVPWLVGFGFVGGGLAWIAGIAIMWASPGWRRGDKFVGTCVPLIGLASLVLALFFFIFGNHGACAAIERMHLPSGCSSYVSDLYLPTAIVLLSIAGLAFVLPAVHLARSRRRLTTAVA